MSKSKLDERLRSVLYRLRQSHLKLTLKQSPHHLSILHHTNMGSGAGEADERRAERRAERLTPTRSILYTQERNGRGGRKRRRWSIRVDLEYRNTGNESRRRHARVVSTCNVIHLIIDQLHPLFGTHLRTATSVYSVE
jgi:hypothetical protein